MGNKTRFAERCPACGCQWEYTEGDFNGSRILGQVNYDRVTIWSCPDCGKNWPRGDKAILRATEQD